MDIKTVRAILAALVVATSFHADAEELFNFGKTWKEWSDLTRDVYLWGFRDGSFSTILTTQSAWRSRAEIDAPDVKKVWDQVFISFEYASIRDVVTNLYKAPANTFVPFHRMVYVARDKLNGENIDEALRKERKMAVELHRIFKAPTQKK